MSEILETPTVKKTYYELNKERILEKRRNDRNQDRQKYNDYMKNLTNKLYQNEEWKKKRLEQKRIIATKHRLMMRGDAPLKKRGRKPKVKDDITTEIIV